MIGSPAGQAQYTPSRYQYGVAVAPTAGQAIVTSDQLAEGLYDIRVYTSYGGTPDVIDNMALQIGNNPVGPLTVVPVANGAPQLTHLPAAYVPLGATVKVVAIAAGGVGTVFRATVIATPLATLSLV